MSQRSMYRAFGFLVAANTEAVLLIIAAISSAKWLDEKYPIQIRWIAITMLLALIIIVHSWLRIFRMLVAKEKSPDEDQKGNS